MVPKFSPLEKSSCIEEYFFWISLDLPDWVSCFRAMECQAFVLFRTTFLKRSFSSLSRGTGNLSLLCWIVEDLMRIFSAEPSELMSLRFKSKHLWLLRCYAPTGSNPKDRAKEIFCQQLVENLQGSGKTVSKRHKTRWFQLPYWCNLHGFDYRHHSINGQWAEIPKRTQGARTKGIKYVFRKAQTQDSPGTIQTQRGDAHLDTSKAIIRGKSHGHKLWPLSSSTNPENKYLPHP